MEGHTLEAYYSLPAPRRPSVTKILFDLKTRELVSPIFVCLHCSMESQTQQHMASHCKQHVRAGMAKGTVDHIKYFPDHTYDFLCNKPKPKPHVPGSVQQTMPQPPNQIYQVPTNWFNHIFPYNGNIMMSELARSPQLKGPHQHLDKVGSSTTPLSVPPVIDLTLRLGPTPSSISEDSMQGTTFPF
ncbi:hypothetical protein SETIT_4G142400v2 [Setaria italica]|uniref:Uncharacterized protein n=2 Tax=Setaria TaxID=4554 RepID=A0A368QUI5_SETIT|nr:hypothetical protein SETIT_4G142400v2 [Setaria italica]TKW21263.1 hypothetical protein SEVIR_4G170800v2 [Setaria viridis]